MWPDDQLRRIRIALDRHDAHLCRWGKADEWIALGLEGSPSLHYHGDRWEASNESLQTLVTQAIGDLTHDHCNGDQAAHLPPRRLDRSHQARPRQCRA
ncbi:MULTISPECIES: hypothetical protein [Cyanophyceae]|uniref:hypothetical protein n=1 Tax=Cyanophyceae TaxID=3028117 RepID=UPI00168650D9|nr:MULTISPECIES: hypothetical protein [Cyanophyceae]MBD1918908.1 hypothetical protein [Phormidium sp. FACHB-77]MBD2033250.1 hypothetical protein [Phormidium sp. FACHB-322]MBD2053817.1 hypothetical protein [Leptolyngbya sp. FACHB-60]